MATHDSTATAGPPALVANDSNSTKYSRNLPARAKSQTKSPRRIPKNSSWLIKIIFVALVLTALVLIGLSIVQYYRTINQPRTIAGLIIGQTKIDDSIPFEQLPAFIAKETKKFNERQIKLQIGSQEISIKHRILGAKIEENATQMRLELVGKTGNIFHDFYYRLQAQRGKLIVPLAVELERDTALNFFLRLKEEIDRPPIAARLDLDHQEIIPGQDGYLLRVYDSLAATEIALHRHQSNVKLAVTVQHPPANDRLANLDIRNVLGQFQTAYSLADKDADRGHNLKVAASKIDGTILLPGETFSFNEVVGPRTEAEGYRMAPIITEGELVDGMAGGACQLSSTLFSAAFFAGLDLVNSLPHTRPSSYIKMGLDAAVAYPGTDMVLKNAYPFPVVIHFKVNQGRVFVRILGQKRPWKKITFEREVLETEPFPEQIIKAPQIPKGKRIISQNGALGFRLERRRLFWGKGAEPDKIEKRKLRYPPTTQIILEGTGPKDPNWKPPPEHSPLGDVPTKFTLEQ